MIVPSVGYTNRGENVLSRHGHVTRRKSMQMHVNGCNLKLLRNGRQVVINVKVV